MVFLEKRWLRTARPPRFNATAAIVVFLSIKKGFAVTYVISHHRDIVGSVCHGCRSSSVEVRLKLMEHMILATHQNFNITPLKI